MTLGDDGERYALGQLAADIKSGRTIDTRLVFFITETSFDEYFLSTVGRTEKAYVIKTATRDSTQTLGIHGYAMSHQHGGIDRGIPYPSRKFLDRTSQSMVCHMEKLISRIGGSRIPNSGFPTELIG